MKKSITSHQLDIESVYELVREELSHFEDFNFSLDRFKEVYRDSPKGTDRQAMVRLLFLLRRCLASVSFKNALEVVAPLQPKTSVRARSKAKNKSLQE